MRLAEPHASEQEQRIVCRTWMLGDLPSSRMSERIALADDEAVERVRARLRISFGLAFRFMPPQVPVHREHELRTRPEQLLEHSVDLACEPRPDLLEVKHARHLAVQPPLVNRHRVNRLNPAADLGYRQTLLQPAQALLPDHLRHRCPPRANALVHTWG